MKNGSNYPILIAELKKILKRKKIQYTDLAKGMGMSESSVKRLMNASDAPLSKIESICQVADINFFDLVTICKDGDYSDYIINEKQDRFFAKNTHYFYFFVHMYENKKTVRAIKKEFNLSVKSINLYLKKLEELELLERHPKDKIVWKIAGAISLRQSGLLSKHLLEISVNNFADVIKDLDYITKHRKKKSLYFHFGDLYLKEESAKVYFDKLGAIIKDMGNQSERESKIFGHDDLTKYSLVHAIMPLSLYYEEIPNL